MKSESFVWKKVHEKNVDGKNVESSRLKNSFGIWRVLSV